MSAVAGSTPLSLAATEGTKVPFIRLDSAFPELFAELMETVERIGRDSAFTLGPELERFEAAFAEFCRTRHAIGVSSGTAALEIALRALGIGPGDEVIVPTYSFIATAEAVSTVGAKPVIVDVDPETALITAEIVEAALTPRTRCVIPVHLFGRPVDMDPLLELCREPRDRRGRGRLPGARRALPRPSGRLARRRRLLQLLPDQEPRRLGRRRCARHQRRRRSPSRSACCARTASAPRHHHELGHRHPPPRHAAGGDPRGQAAPPRRLEPASPRRRRGAARGPRRHQRRLPRPGRRRLRPRLPPLRRPL